MDNLIPVEGTQNLYRDMSSGAIVSTDNHAYSQYIAQRERRKKEQDEIRREQRLIQKEIEKRARFEEIDKNLKSSSSGLENFNIDKSKEN